MKNVIGEADANPVQAITGALADAQRTGRKQRLTKPRCGREAAASEDCE